jgi:hypothetical protein
MAAVVLATAFAVSFAQPEQPPARTEPAEPPAAPPPAAPDEDEPDSPPAAASDEADDVFIPTEELQPDAAVTFPVDI